jgi:hypothetical protein
MLASIPGKELHIPTELKAKLATEAIILPNSLPLSVSLVSWNSLG